MSAARPRPTDDVVMVGERSGVRYFHIRPEWAAEVAALDQLSHPSANPDHIYDEASMTALVRDFPEGCFAGFADDRVVALGVGLRLDFDFEHPQHTVLDIVPDDHDQSGHDPTGLWYYGTGIATHPDYRRRGIGAELYELRKQVCRDLNLAGIVAGGVIPGYADHKHAMSADEYVAEVVAGRIYDATLTFQLEHGFEAPCALEGYIEDPETDNWACLIVWHNPDHDPSARSATTT